MVREGTQGVHNADSRNVRWVLRNGHDGEPKKSKARMRVEWRPVGEMSGPLGNERPEKAWVRSCGCSVYLS